jgi:exonuclease III
MECANTNIISWNVRGLNNPSRHATVKRAVEEALASVVCVMESKLDVVNQFLVYESFGARFDGYVYLPAVGTAGGVIIAWHSPDVQVLASRVDRFSVSVHLSPRDGDAWWLTAVYGPTIEALKPEFLDELRMLRAAIVGPWAITGDFNLILEACDKNNSRLNRRSMARFRQCVNDLELMESTLIGRRFTWSNERETATLVKLDRWFGSVEWDELHPDASLTACSSSLSDHCPILMSTSVQLFTMRRFRFERVWLRMDGFLDVVRELWESVPAHGDALQRLNCKLRGLARGLQSWSQRKVGSIRDQLRAANELIFMLDKAQDGRRLTPEEAWLRRAVKARLLGLASLDRTIARQRARVADVKEGDANTQFFRTLASARRRRNHIAMLHFGETVAHSQEDKEDLATSFYNNLFGGGVSRGHDLSLAAAGLTALDLSDLEAAFTVEETWTAIKDMPANRAPGPDGFSWDFYKSCWPIIRADMFAAL